jgi:hypothetical protein
VADDLHGGLWNAEISAADYTDTGERYQGAILEQYKIYVEMADRVSARRATANTFFLTLNTSVFTIFGVFWSSRPDAAPWWLAFPVVALMGECAAWFYLVRSYRQLNTAKYEVIGAMEERLPTSPYWKAEWKALGEGREKSKYWPPTHLEQWVPTLFATIYLVGFVIAIIS